MIIILFPLQEELDAKVLLVQNKNLSMKLEWLRSEVKDLKSKNVNLEKAKEMHDSTISTVGRFWERVSQAYSYQIVKIKILHYDRVQSYCIVMF